MPFVDFSKFGIIVAERKYFITFWIDGAGELNSSSRKHCCVALILTSSGNRPEILSLQYAFPKFWNRGKPGIMPPAHLLTI